MILLKSFFRKKTIKNYLIIFLLIFTLIFIAYRLKDYYIKKNNEIYKSSYIEFKDTNISKESIINNNIKNIKEKIVCRYDNSFKYFIADDNVSDGETLAPKEMLPPNSNTKTVEIGDILTSLDIDLEFRVTEIQLEDTFYHISKNDFEKLKNKDFELSYAITLKDYRYKDDTEKELQEKFSNAFISFRNETRRPSDYTSRIEMINIFVIICVIFFGIVFVITLINIIIDEGKTNKLYYVIGYNKVKIGLIFISKVIFLILIPLLIALGITSIIFKIIK